MTDCSPAVGVIGVGNMGGAMAQRLLDCGHRVAVWDLDPSKTAFLGEKGAFVQHPRCFVATKIVAVIVAVVDAAQTQDVLFGDLGVVHTLTAGTAVMLCPTISPEDAASLCGRLEDCGMAALDAPMSGGPQRARDGSMSLMVACKESTWLTHQAWLAQLSSKLFRVGERFGDAARTKLVNNLLAAVNLVGTAQALALASNLGLDRAATLAVIEQSSGQSWIGTDRGHRAINGDETAHAHISLLHKDTRLALAMAALNGTPVELGAFAHASFDGAVRAGLQHCDDSKMMDFMLRREQ